MTVSFEVIRPDDLLRLRIEARNLRIDRPSGQSPALVVEDATQPAFLVVFFPPQAIAEASYPEAQIVPADLPPGAAPEPPVPIVVPPSPGLTPARLARGSRLVFRVPANTRIPYTVEGVLDWSNLSLSVNGIAAIGPTPSEAEIAAAPAIAPPGDTETAIELPYRLVVSPTAEVRWGHRRSAFTARGRTELWHTRLQLPPATGEPVPAELSARRPASLRAIWSDDYGVRNTDDPDLPFAAMSPDDRHQIVVKTSAFRGWEREVSIRLPQGGGPTRGPRLLASPATLAIKRWVPYVPQPFQAQQLMLSSLGGWLHSRGAWDVLRKARPVLRPESILVGDVLARLAEARNEPRRGARTPAPSIFAPLSPAVIDALASQPAADAEVLDLSEWVHVATQGRDHYVRIVHEGELLPFHHRAAMVTVTERKFRNNGAGPVVANLYQRHFIVVREPEVRFQADDRGMPLKRVRITSLVTPDIAWPPATGPHYFWVEVMRSAAPGDRARLRFPVLATDVEGDAASLSIPMMFVALGASSSEKAAAVAAYNDSASSAAMADRSATLNGQKVRFAPSGASASDNPRLETRSMTFALADGAPRLLKAEVNVPQVQQILGKDAATTIRLYQGYIASGLDAGAGVFAEIVREAPAAGDAFAAVVADTLGVKFSSDQAGGFATPNLGVSTLTRERGPIAGKVADALLDQFDPKSFFPAGTAMLFGTFDLFDILLGSTLGKGAPQMQTRVETIAGVQTVVATLDWKPPVQTKDLGIAAFLPGPTTQLDVTGRIEKPLDAPAQAPTSHFKGRLNDFRVSVLKAVEVRFTEFGFETRSGRKPDITVKLDPAKPLAFMGDLSFVEELRKVIPPDLFGKGPSLDLSPSGVRAGFSFALPPVAVGVFALRDISLGAALSLPFLDGRPTLDFNVSERPHPFLLSVGIFGGGGFFRLQLDTAGIRVVEAAFEFGATASVDLGVASGGVHIMAGIYFKLERRDPGNELEPTLGGYLRMGGHLSVIGLIKVSLEFVLSFTYTKGKAYGRATLTVKVEIAFFSVSVDITVERAFGGSNGDPTFRQLFISAAPWTEYAEAFA